jgi:hypothetical protein
MQEFKLPGRNQFFFWMYNRFNDANLTLEQRLRFVEQAYYNLRDKSDFSFEEACSAARVRGM